MKFHLHPQFTREYWQRENSLVYMSDRNDFASLFLWLPLPLVNKE